MKTAVIFGGSGFIGMFFAEHLLNTCSFNKVYILDLESPYEKDLSFRKQQFKKNLDSIYFVKCDVRKKIDWIPEEKISLIANFAAIHREPGHENHEYYETNILGAENVCSWAEVIACDSIIFSSSIAPYGVEEIQKNELSIPVPVTAYGGSKLVAEKIHTIWHEKDSLSRNLIIVRPGVVFGPGEGGNVSRLIKAIKNRYFVYIGNQHIRKAGVYIKELCHAMTWCLKKASTMDKKVILFNMTMNPGPSVKEYVISITNTLGIRTYIPRVPFKLLLFLAYLIDFFAKPFRIKHPFSPVRVNKLVKSNDIKPLFLTENNYKFLFDLDQAFLDWKKDCPDEW
tara:strand:- start:5428 stop:6447 length:1020 start_codon:yes stop_codon:yes gene_type:complete